MRVSIQEATLEQLLHRNSEFAPSEFEISRFQDQSPEDMHFIVIKITDIMSSNNEFEEVVTALRRREQEEAEICRRRCKITWLKEGEAPSRYFFARLRAKHSHEEMSALEVAPGQIVEEPEGVLEEVHKFYKDLYNAEEESDEMLEKRRMVVGRIEKRLTVEQNTTLEAIPSVELINRIVKEMPKEKSPGIDGVMVEILRIGWEFMEEDCVQMVRSFWDKKKLIGKDGRGVIKLIPKNERKHLLQNWRPITLLTMTYKIVAKIIAIRLKDMLPGIIDTQQTGFVAGRNIIDNILSLRLGQEWAQITNQDVIFVKLDFMKAYDRVAHRFLWDTLAAMGMGAETVDRIKGLVVGGSSEVHVNGSFTEEFQIERGVRQGCPLAPLLFAMTTQPLMSALRAEERRGNIRGLNIGDGQTLLHQLFADDTGICITAEERQFETLKEVIKEFEMASGARLNLQKSIVMQLKPRQPPPWMEQSGCEIAVPGRNFRYLGVATSSPIDERAITEEIVQKMMKKLKHWSNRLLSWPAKTILLKHVLAATPLYQLLSVGLCRDGLEELEKLCRNFLWGWNEEGNPKHALIAWERLAQEKKRGGIGWTSFKVMADALNVRLMGRILEGGDAEWIHLARSFILRTLRRGSYQRECHQWSLQECLLLLPFTRVDGSPTLTRLLGSWFRARKKLQWNSVGGELDERMSILQVKAVYQIAERRGVGSLQLGRELGVLRRNRITTLAEAFQASRNGGWQQYLRQHGSYPEEETLLKLHNLEEWCMKQLVVRKDIMDLHGWSWEAQSGEFRWIRTTREWRTSFTKGKDFCEKLEEKWSRASQKLRWKERWKLLWSAPIAYRRKVWLWKILQRGFFTNHRAAEMGLQNGECSKCLDIPETLEHIMWMCSKTEERRRQLVALTVPERSATNLLEWIDVSLMRAQSSPASLIICILYCWTAWRERNEWQFCHKHVNRPVHSLLREVGLEVRAMENESKSEKRTRALELAKKEVLNWQSRWENLRRENRIS
ncbi:hypothetical protein R1sor_025914 [Riccia sorocarpa]|uniref:Reverse transcriptase domain-containing protein n=1 Tax=Riccia sorocarpa TaxID=122646 RepID=A0ABD3GBC2_9MARC